MICIPGMVCAYTTLMISCLVIVMSAMHVTAATDVPPEQRRSFVITPEEGAPFYGFYDDAKEVSGGGLSIELDTPWAPGTRIIKKTAIKAYEEETPEERTKRVSEGIQNAGMAYVNGRFYNATEVQLAERAREMAGIKKTADTKSEDPDGEVRETQSGNSAEIVQPNPDSKTKTGGLAQWKTHIGIVLLALILIGGVVFVFRKHS